VKEVTKMAYKFSLTLEYDLEADNEEDAIAELVYAIGHDWIEYADNGELVEIPALKEVTE